jgi:GT2 family glycosyltransferase
MRNPFLDLGRGPGFWVHMCKEEGIAAYGVDITRFREDLGPNSENLIRGEDSEFSQRLIGGKEKLMYAPKMVVYHPVDERRTQRKYFETWYFGYRKRPRE